MALKGPIIIVEDDVNDADVIVAAIRDIGITNETKVMHSAAEAYDYLSVTEDQPYVILCDIRMPGTDGLALRKNIVANETLRRKSIPFVFFTGIVSQAIVNSAYELDVQGFFEKGGSYERIREQLTSIFLYWKGCMHPNRADVLK